MADLMVLHERIVRTIRQATDDGASSTDDYAAELIPLVREEVRKAAKKAWDQCAMEQATWPRPAGNPRALTFVLLANNPYGDEEKR